MKRFLFFFIEKVLFSFLCAFIPVRKELLLFGSGFNRFADNPKFLFLHFQNNPSFKTVWVSSNRSEVIEMRRKGYDCIYKWSLRTFWTVIRASKWFVSHKVADVFPFIPDRTILINLWHGTPIKKIGFDSLKEEKWIEKTIKSGRKLPYERWNYFITASENTNFIFKSAMRLEENNIKALGQPRNQPIYDSIIENRALKALEDKMPILKNKQKVLYTPTFRNNDSSTNQIRSTLLKINGLLQKNNELILLFKPHPLDKAIFDKEFFKQLTSVFNVSSEDTQELLCASDILITDYSSIVFDFMITEKPIIAYIFDKKEYIQENGGLYFSFDELGANIANNEEELFHLITHIETLRNDYDSRYFNTPESSERIAGFVQGLT